MTHLPKPLAALAFLLPIVAGGQQNHAQAGSYDIDCKIILCLPAGFPSGCGDAYRTFIDRITSVPPRPPIGFCPMGSARDVEMHDSHPDRMTVMLDAIDEERMTRTLRSVKVEHYHRRTLCCLGRECDRERPCTDTYFIDGDGGSFRRDTIDGHHIGSKVIYTDLEGEACTAGNAESWVPPEQECRPLGENDNGFCRTVAPGYWRKTATCGSP